MGKLIYSGTTSLDGYLNDADGSFAWSAPDEEVHSFVNDKVRPVGTYLFGRRMYEVMRVWETLDTAGEPEVMADFAGIWRDSDKIVYSSTLDATSTSRTRLERSFDVDEIARMKTASDRDLCVGGAGLAATAIRAGLVDEYHQYLAPIIVGGGTRFYPDDALVELELLEEHRFTSGVVYVRYRPRR
ncbi:dihydrofolate reductase family protein [Diaminobutyricibacter sp. McL0608]|uniref:dihydrofolate reductase family protein n=1 Tax=Leifsonia sp. McL0608 TaxID=3143537 RepID=UPI0031F2F619